MNMYSMNRKRTTELSNDELRRVAPSIFATTPWEGMSERYRFVPTIEVVDAMRGTGFAPVAAQQGNVRIPGKQEFTKHMIRFQRTGDALALATVGEEVPEIILLNSHDGTSAYQLGLGMLRLVCLNGLMVASGNLSTISCRHSGARDLAGRVIDASYEVIEQAPAVASKVAEFKQIKLSQPMQIAYAGAALEVKASTLEIEPAAVLRSYRREDTADDNGARSIWQTYNVVQENLMRGGFRGTTTTGNRQRARAIKSVSEDVRINRALWRLTEEMAKLAA